MSAENQNLHLQTIQNKIYHLRSQAVMLDRDLATIYGYTTKDFNRQVKNNITKFDSDFRFQLTSDEILYLRRNFSTANISSKSRTLPYVFTEPGIYMLMTVLKGELAIKQSKLLIRLFQQMKNYIITQPHRRSISLQHLTSQVQYHELAIHQLQQAISTNPELTPFITPFSPIPIHEILILDGQLTQAHLAYQQLYQQARYSIYLIDNYISLQTLLMFKDLSTHITVTIFSDNVTHGLHAKEVQLFRQQYPNISLQFYTTQGRWHDRFIILDFNQPSQKIYHAGTSTKNIGSRITVISRLHHIQLYQSLIQQLHHAPPLTF